MEEKMVLLYVYVHKCHSAFTENVRKIRPEVVMMSFWNISVRKPDKPEKKSKESNRISTVPYLNVYTHTHTHIHTSML